MLLAPRLAFAASTADVQMLTVAVNLTQTLAGGSPDEACQAELQGLI